VNRHYVTDSWSFAHLGPPISCFIFGFDLLEKSPRLKVFT